MIWIISLRTVKTIAVMASMLCFSKTEAQKYYLGNEKEFSLLAISSSTGVHTYRYIGDIRDQMFDRKIGDIIVGIRDNHVVTTIYNLVPKTAVIGVPASIIKLIENNLPHPLTFKDGGYGISIDNRLINISREKNYLTFGKDRIIFYSSVKYSELKN